MASQEEYTTFCHICPNHCAVTAVVGHAKVVEVKAAGESEFPIRMCSVQKGADYLIGTVNSGHTL